MGKRFDRCYLLSWPVVSLGLPASLAAFSLAGSLSCAAPGPQYALPAPVAAVAPINATGPVTVASEVANSPLVGVTQMAVDLVVREVLARNPSLAQMIAAWQAASARYPQVTSLDDPMFTGDLGPGSFGSNKVDFAYRV